MMVASFNSVLPPPPAVQRNAGEASGWFWSSRSECERLFVSVMNCQPVSQLGWVSVANNKTKEWYVFKLEMNGMMKHLFESDMHRHPSIPLVNLLLLHPWDTGGTLLALISAVIVQRPHLHVFGLCGKGRKEAGEPRKNPYRFKEQKKRMEKRVLT